MNYHRASLTALLCLSLTTPSWGAPLTLKECLEQAVAGNPSLKSAAWDSKVARDGEFLTKAATLPRVDVTAGYTMQLEPQAVKLGGVTAETQDATYATAGVAATYTVYDFGRREARIGQAQSATRAAMENFQFARSDVSLQVIEAFYRILEAEKIIQAATEEITQITEHRRVAQVLLEEGVVTRNDVLQAEVRLASAKQKKLSITNQYENSWLWLNYLTGREPAFRSELDQQTTPITAEPAPLTGTAINQRHDVLAQRQLLEASEFGIRENRENYLPEIFTRVAADYAQNDKVREQTIYSATLGIRLNIFDGSVAESSHGRAVKLRSKQLDTLRATEQRALLEVATAANDTSVARERIAVTEAAIRQSEENLRINQERYQERVGIASEVLDAQTLVTQTKTEYYRAFYDYQTASARLMKARGEL